MKRINLSKLSFVIVTHVYATGPAFKLEEYLRHKARILIFIGHPFSYAKETNSFLRIYKNGRLIRESKLFPLKAPEFFFYIKDVIITLWWIFRYAEKMDYFIGCDNMNAFSGYLLKIIGRVRYTVFYTIDYVPQRFKSNIFNSIYHYFDRHAVKKSDKVWNLSSVMTLERERRGVSTIYRKKQIAVPIGTDISSPPLPFNKVDRYKITHMGHLLPKQGVEMLIQAMKDVVKKIPRAHLLIIGGGPIEKKLRKDVLRLKLEKNIKFTGFLEKFSDVQRYLSNSAIAVAPYSDDPNNYTRYTDPGKPKDYIASSIPVVITKVPNVAYEIEKNRCGIAIEYNKNELVGALIKLLTDEKMLIEFRKNAIKMAKKYTWDIIYNNALRETL